MGRHILALEPIGQRPGHRRLELTDVQRPHVQHQVLEFYATWCKPRMAAVPRWKKLHETYRKQGLRLVVVSTQDPAGMCRNPGWNPDQTVCAVSGDLARAMGVGDQLPAAFLWSWRGNLLVRKGHVSDVERALKEAMRTLPRVALQTDDVPKKHRKPIGPDRVPPESVPLV